MNFKVSSLNRVLSKVFLCAVFMLAAISLYGQQTKIDVSGTVTDAQGMSVIGATVAEKGTSNGTTTDLDGKFSIKVNPNSTVVISYLGSQPHEVVVKNNNQTGLKISLKEDSKLMDEVVVVGYGSQKKVTVTGAVSAIKGDDIITTKNENVQNMLTGKVPGLRVVQKSSEPGQYNSTMDIRGLGSPLVVIDGVPRGNMARLDADDIESISVLKDASAAIYGVNAANGVVLVTTKKGEKGKMNLSYSGSYSWQMPSNFPDLVGAADWMTLFNERGMHSVDSPKRTYTDEEINAYRDGTSTSTDWKSAVFRTAAPQTSHTINANGGSDILTYFASFGYQSQESFLETNAMNYDKYTIRANAAAQINKNMKLEVNLAGLMDERKSSVYGSSDIVRAMWCMRPMDQIYNEEQQMYAQPINKGMQNPVAMMNGDLTGGNGYKSKWFQSNFSLRYDMPFLKGLYARAMYSYDYTLNENKEYIKAYQLYASDAKKAYTWNSSTKAPNKISRYFYGKDAMLWNAQIGFDRQFGKHNVSAMALYEDTHKKGDNFYGSKQVLLPMDQVFAGIADETQFLQSIDEAALYDYAYNAYLGRLKYDYAGKYMAEFTYRYESSSRFPDNSRWAGTPGFSAGWRISEEGFFKNSPLKFINNLKLRASYAKMLDDSGVTGYTFLSGYYYPSGNISDPTKPANPYNLPGGYVIDGAFINTSQNKGIPNKAITWYKSGYWNFGMDMEAWNGLLGVTAEYFERNRTGLLRKRTESVPGIVGAVQPQENLDGDLTRGFELELSHRNRIEDFSYEIRGNVSYTRIKTLHYEQAKPGNSYLNWRNNNNDRYNNVWWGYGENGRITDWNEIYNNPVYIGRGTTMGDYEYQDWNHDGQINDLDVHPLATNGLVPLINFGLTLSGSWRGIDLSMLWQGAGQRYVAPREFLYQPLWSDTNALTQFLDRWHPTDPNASPYNPATQWASGEYALTGSSPNYNSEFNIQNAAYLRLKSIELGYTLPKQWLSKVGVQNLRLYVNAYNLLTFTDLKFMDPEFFTNPDTTKGGLGDYGYNYPLNKTVTVGLNVKF